MTDNNTLSFSQLPSMIKKIEELVALVPKDQLNALKAIQMLLEIVNGQGIWIDGLKKELTRLDNLNKSQVEMIRNLKGIVV